MGPESINSKVKCKDIPELSDWKASIAFADDATVVMNKLKKVSFKPTGEQHTNSADHKIKNSGTAVKWSYEED